jgi:dipeptidyl aminopeptidase/acylaminoacyl peptidase
LKRGESMRTDANARLAGLCDSNGLRAIGLMLVLVPVLLVWATPAQATFPGSNGKIAFASSDGTGIYTINADGSGVANVTSGYANTPVWSPDGTKIAFERNNDIYVVNSDGSGERSITGPPLQAGGGEGLPTWSSDGSEIAFSKFVFVDGQTPHLNIYKTTADGLFETRLTDYSGNDLWADWSPDGQKIAFARDEVIHVMNADGTGVTSLGVSGIAPSWSPDGRLLAFDGDAGIYVTNADGSNVVQITSNSGDGGPAWSPDGSKIAFDSGGRGGGAGFGVFVMNADGSGITQSTGSGDQPDWQALTPCTRIAATPGVLTKANHDLVLVTLAPADRPGPLPTAIVVNGVTQDEPLTGKGDDTTPDAARALRPDQVYVRAERNPQGDGRVYRIAYTALDGAGPSCAGTAIVQVPRQGSTAVDSAPPSYDSFGG